VRAEGLIADHPASSAPTSGAGSGGVRRPARPRRDPPRRRGDRAGTGREPRAREARPARRPGAPDRPGRMGPGGRGRLCRIL